MGTRADCRQKIPTGRREDGAEASATIYCVHGMAIIYWPDNQDLLIPKQHSLLDVPAQS